MTFRRTQRGFTLLISIILSSVVLALGLALLDIAYKQIVLATTAKQSQNAFYNADTALECALYWDQKLNAFDYDAPATSITCNNKTMVFSTAPNSTTAANNNRRTTVYVPCTPSGTNAVITVDKSSTGTTTLYAVGYNSCNGSDTHRVERGLTAYYGGGETVATPSPAPEGTLTYLIVAGGGAGGGSTNGGGEGGGGAGGALTGELSSIAVGSYAVTVGAGGTSPSGGPPANGGNSSALGLTAIGGGKAGYGNGNAPGNGGSGGGADYFGTVQATGTAGQGSNGGIGNVRSSPYPGAGGGGAGGVGGNASSGVAGNGGAGISSDISGTAHFYAGGGGGGVRAGGTAGTGGSGVGGNGCAASDCNGGNATYYGGGGGGAAQSGLNSKGGSGYQGIVIIRYPTGWITATGGTITIDGTDTIHTFTSSGTFQVTSGAEEEEEEEGTGRVFTVSPALAGKTTWDLDVDGAMPFTTSGTWTITPSASFSVPVKMWGAGGGGASGQSGGAGGYAGATVSFTSGTAYTVHVGGGGGQGTSNGGGGGGGRSDIMQGSTPVLIAGGGGGAGWTSNNGGAGGGSTGVNGGGGASNVGGTMAGAGGTSSAGGAGGVGLNGGSGGSGGTSGSKNGQAGGGFDNTSGGGGGAYNGGAGGASGANGCCGGGGGGAVGGGSGGSGGSAAAGGSSSSSTGGSGGTALGGGGGGGGYMGGGGGGYYGGGGGGSGYSSPSNISATLTAGSGTTPGNSADADRGSAGGASTGSGTAGKVLIGTSSGGSGPTAGYTANVNFLRSPVVFTQNGVNTARASLSASQLTVADQYSSTYAGSKAVNGSVGDANRWTTSNSTNVCDLWIRTNGTTNISKITIQSADYPGFIPTVLNIQYWNGSAWTTHFTANTTQTSSLQTFTTANVQYAEYWRFVSTGVLHNGGSSNCNIEELQAFP